MGVALQGRYLVIANAALIVLTFLLTYLLTFVIFHKEHYPNYFLSVSLNFSPASNVGSLFLSPAAFCMPFIAYIRFCQVEECTPENEKTLKVNRVALILATISAIGAHGVASFQVRDHLEAHLGFAAIFFTGSLLYMYVTVYIDHVVPKVGHRKARVARKVLAILDSVLLVVMFALWFKFSLQGNKNKPLECLSAILEVLVLACVLLIYFTFIEEFKDLQINLLVVHAAEPKNDVATNEDDTDDDLER